jgi:TRAP transporter 4TM/12TM fusion protein
VDQDERSTHQVAVALASVASTAAIGLGLFHYWTGWNGGLPFVEQRSVHLAVSLLVVWFGLFSFGRRKDVPYYVTSALGLVITLGFCAYIFTHDDDLLSSAKQASVGLLVWSGLMLIFLLETTRRVVGLTLPIIAVAIGAVMLVAPFSPFASWVAPTNVKDIANTIGFTDHGIVGSIMGVSAGIVAGFLVLGSLLGASGGAQSFLGLARFLVGRFRGGPAKVSLVTSALFGTVSGSAIANVVVDGVFNIPLMKRSGYKPEFAAAVEATASTGGQIVPPVMGAAAFLMAQFLDVPYSTVVIAAIIPAILYYVALFVSIHIEALKLGLPAMPKDQLPKLREIVSAEFFLSFLLPMGVLLYVIYGMGRSMLFASFAASSVTIIYMLIDRRHPLRVRALKIIDGFRQAGVEIARMTAIIISAQIIVTLLGMSGLGARVANEVAGIEIPIELALVFIAVVVTVLGFGVPTSAAYILAASIAAPMFVAMGVDIFAGHFFIFYLAVFSAVTPPVMPAVFAAVGIARSSMNATGMTAMRLLSPAMLIPFVFVLEPALLLRDEDPIATVYAVVRLGVGMIAVAAGLACWLGRPMPRWAGAAVALGGALIAWPTTETTFIGAALVGVGIVTVVRRGRGADTIGTHIAAVGLTGQKPTELDAPAWAQLVSGMRGVLLEREIGPGRGVLVAAPLTVPGAALIRAAKDLSANITHLPPGGPGPLADAALAAHRHVLAITTPDDQKKWADRKLEALTAFDVRLLAATRATAAGQQPRDRVTTFTHEDGAGYSLVRWQAKVGTEARRAAAIGIAFGIVATDRLLIATPAYEAVSQLVLEAVSARNAAFVLDEDGGFEASRWLPAVAAGHVTTGIVSTSQLRAIVEEIERTHATIPTSLSAVIHGGEICPADLKRRAIDVFGPILIEYYATPDLAAGTVISSEDWIAHEGSVGKVWSDDLTVRVQNERGEPVPAGQRGAIVFVAAGQPAIVTGDTGRVDDHGFLYVDERGGASHSAARLTQIPEVVTS